MSWIDALAGFLVGSALTTVWALVKLREKERDLRKCVDYFRAKEAAKKAKAT